MSLSLYGLGQYGSIDGTYGCGYGNDLLGGGLDNMFMASAYGGNSIFGGMGYGNYLNMLGYGGMSFGGMSRADMQKLMNMSYEQRQEYFAQMQERALDLSAERQEKMYDKVQERNIKRIQRVNGIQEGENTAKMAAQKIADAIVQNRKDEIIPAYNELKAYVAQMPQNKKLVKLSNGQYVEKELSGKELDTKAREYYRNVMGRDLCADIETNLSGSFTQGFKNGLTLGALGDNTDADRINEQIMGFKRDGSNRIARGAGRTAGGATAGAATGAIIGSIVPVIGTAVGAGVGALIGGIGGFISSWF